MRDWIKLLRLTLVTSRGYERSAMAFSHGWCHTVEGRHPAWSTGGRGQLRRRSALYYRYEDQMSSLINLKAWLFTLRVNSGTLATYTFWDHNVQDRLSDWKTSGLWWRKTLPRHQQRTKSKKIYGSIGPLFMATFPTIVDDSHQLVAVKRPVAGDDQENPAGPLAGNRQQLLQLKGARNGPCASRT